MIPVALPATVFALALLWTWVFVPLPIYGTIWVLLIAFIAVFIPYGMRSTSASLHQIYPDLEAASLVCGGSKLYTFRKILLPLLKPSLIATWIIVFTGVIKEFSAALFLSSSGSETISLQIYQYWFYLSFSEPAVVCVFQILLILSVIIIFQRIFKADITKVY
jgi:iron(III) transport system permease protein